MPLESNQPSPGNRKLPDTPGFPGVMLPLLLLTTIFLLNFLARIVLGPVLPAVISDLGLSQRAAGSLFLYISIGYSFMLLASGWIPARLNHKNRVTLSIAAVGAALFLVTVLQEVSAVRLALTFLGLAAGLYLPSALAQLTALGEPASWGKMIAVHELAPNLAALAAPVLSGMMLPVIGWRGIMVLIGAAALLAAGANARWIRLPGTVNAGTFDFSLVKQLVENRSLWVMIVLFSLGIGSNIGVFSMLPLYLVGEVGYSQAESDQILAWTRLATPIFVLLGGWVADRAGRERTMGAALLLSGLAISLIGALRGSGLLVLLFVQPLAAVCFFPSAFAVLSNRGDGQTRNLVVSLTIPLATVLGTGVVPSLIGWAGDFGRIGSGITAFGLMVLGGGIMYLILSGPRNWASEI